MKKKYALSATIIFMLIAIALMFLRHSHTQDISLRQAGFNRLPGWNNADISKSLAAFQNSCKTFLRQNPENAVGSQQIHMKVKDWQPACRAAMSINPVSEALARDFFQTWFTPVEFYNKQPVSGLFTGYYLPLLHGSAVETAEYNVPIYGMPANMMTLNPSDFAGTLKQKLTVRIEGSKILPYYNREAINNGAIKDKAPVLVWVNNHIDRLFLEIQGSGIVKLTDGRKMYLGYAGENGAGYTAIGSNLIKRGVMTRKTASMQGIRTWLEAHPEEILPVTNTNKSFVFFRILNHSAAMGAQGINLTAGYSLAVDRKWIPLGTPMWLDTTRPSTQSERPEILQRLMIAQDTGGAIKGVVRGDVFWGAGERATYIAGKMKNQGHYWLLLPRHRIAQLQSNFTDHQAS